MFCRLAMGAKLCSSGFDAYVRNRFSKENLLGSLFGAPAPESAPAPTKPSLLLLAETLVCSHLLWGALAPFKIFQNFWTVRPHRSTCKKGTKSRFWCVHTLFPSRLQSLAESLVRSHQVSLRLWNLAESLVRPHHLQGAPAPYPAGQFTTIFLSAFSHNLRNIFHPHSLSLSSTSLDQIQRRPYFSGDFGPLSHRKLHLYNNQVHQFEGFCKIWISRVLKLGIFISKLVISF